MSGRLFPKASRRNLLAIDKKRKSEDTDNEFDLNAIDVDLAEFNCTNMENLKINDNEEDNEVSVKTDRPGCQHGVYRRNEWNRN